jgi:hypothetical protein
MKWLLLIAAIPLLLTTGALLLNRPPLSIEPGPWERLKTYLTQNVAETLPDHRFPELRTPLFSATADAVRTATLEAMRDLGWEQVQAGKAEIRGVVVSSLFRFRDDISVRLEETAGGTLFHARSASRIGRGDLAANGRHLRELFAAVANRLERRQDDLAPPGQGESNH